MQEYASAIELPVLYVLAVIAEVTSEPPAIPQETRARLLTSYEEPAESITTSRYAEVSQEDCELIAKIVCLEARGEPLESRQAAAEVILNRIAADNLYPDSRKHNKEAIIRITEGVCSAMRAEGTVVFEDPGIPPVINDPETTQAILAAAEKILGKGHGIITEFPSMGSDDFSVFLEYSRGVQFFVGSANNDPATKIGLHCGDNVFDQSALSVGVSVLTQYVLDALGA